MMTLLFHNITCYSYSLLSCIHVNITKLFNVMCTLVAISMITEFRVQFHIVAEGGSLNEIEVNVNLLV